MKKNLKCWIKIFFVLLILFIPFYLSPVVKADSGWDSNYGSGGSSSSGSSSNRNYGSGDTGELAGILFSIFFFGSIFALYLAAKRKGLISSSRISLIDNYNDISEERIKTYLPEENLDNLKNSVFETFVKIQEAWMDFDYDKLREFCTDELYNSYVSLLETLKLKNGQNIMNNFDNEGVRITNIEEVNGEIILTVFLAVHFYDYVINTNSNEVIRGSKNSKIFNNYEFESR